MRLVWFGASDVVGAELVYLYGSNDAIKNDPRYIYASDDQYKHNRPDLSYTTLTSNQLNCDFYNYGFNGSSMQFMQYSLIKYIKEKYEPNSVAIFNIPIPQTRYFTVTDDDKLEHQNINTHNFHINNYEIAMFLNGLYSICKVHDIVPYFLNAWEALEINEDFFIVPDSAWLLPKNTSLCETAWKFKKTPDMLWHKVNKKNAEIYLKYIQPCTNHPNQHGHQAISDTLVDLLKDKIA